MVLKDVLGLIVDPNIGIEAQSSEKFLLGHPRCAVELIVLEKMREVLGSFVSQRNNDDPVAPTS
jgi:hypothetical protein